MIREGFLIKDSILTTDQYATVAEMAISKNVDKVVLGVSNEYVGAGSDTVTFRIFAQFCPGGGFWELGSVRWNAGGGSLSASGSASSPLQKGVGFWGVIDFVDLLKIKVEAFRTGTNPVPVSVEIACFSEGLD